MRTLRPVLALLLGSSLLLAGHAGAAAKSCNLVKDDAGDAGDPVGSGRQVAAANDKMKDILGADFSANTATVSGVIKLAQAPGPNPQALGGLRYYVEFAPGSVPTGLFFRAAADTTGKLTYNVGKITTSETGGKSYSSDLTIPVKGKLVGSTISMTVSTAALKPLGTFKKGSKINQIFASSFGVAGTPNTGISEVPSRGFLLGGDETDPAKKPYVFGTPSCVVPVK